MSAGCATVAQPADTRMLCYVTISTFSLYVSLIGFMEKNDGDDDDDNELVSKLRMSGTKYPLPLHALMACTGRTLNSFTV
jgi:hypothetical protein